MNESQGQSGENCCAEGKRCGCVCHRTIGVLVALVGLTFLLRELGTISTHLANMIWPILIIGIGLKKSFRGMCRCCPKS
ncbi:MAG: DUF5668 domain-containing protein [Candidatus Margulisiibacteriota bacterium]